MIHTFYIITCIILYIIIIIVLPADTLFFFFFLLICSFLEQMLLGVREQETHGSWTLPV